MHINAQRLLPLGYMPASEVTESQQTNADYFITGSLRDRLVLVPGLPNYLPPMIPMKADWLTSVQRLAHASFLGLIADIWTQLLVAKMDSKERGLYILWDDNVPKPSRLTSLAWLLTCETWPMPTHRDLSHDLGLLFPPQPFMIPQSTPFGHAGTAPHGFAYGRSPDMRARTLNSLFGESLNRTDRENMAKVANHTAVYRPPSRVATGYGFHTQPQFERAYSMERKWSRTTSVSTDQGYGAHEIQESIETHRAIDVLRQVVMKDLLTVPGLPTHRDNLHSAPGMWIRHWSQIGIVVRYPVNEHKWTPDGDSIKLEHGIVMKRVPAVAPRTWFGFTQLGHADPSVVQDGDSQPSIAESASERWVFEYQKHRAQALAMLFDPEGIDIDTLLEEAASARAKRLERAGRLKKSSGAKPTNGFAAAFAAAIKPTQE